MTMIERVARAIMLDDGCGLTLNGERVFCDSPGLPHEARGARCGCKCAARAAIEALDLCTTDYSDDPAHLKRLLLQRDSYIVDKGLWNDFVGSIRSAALSEGKEG